MTHARNAVRLAALLLAIAVVTSCTGGGTHAAPGPALSRRDAAMLGTGYLYLLGGQNPISQNLWVITLPSGKTRQLTHNPAQDGVSNFNASPAGIVMGDAATSLDVLDALKNGKAVQIGDGTGDSPIINDQGQIANQLDAYQLKPGGYYSIILRDGIGGTPHVIYRERQYTNLFTAAWSPDGRDILIRECPNSETYSVVYVLTTSGKVIDRLRLQGAPTISWGQAGLALSSNPYGPPSPDEIISLSGKVLYRIPASWAPMCWNPAGTELLVSYPSGA
jgi:hypothetical protein